VILCRVVGTVVATHRCDDIPGARYLLVQATDMKGQGRTGYHVALDPLGAGPGELVLLSRGSSARQTESSHQKPVDAIVAGIVDQVDAHGHAVYRK